MIRIDIDWNLEKLIQCFQLLILQKSLKKLLWLVILDEICIVYVGSILYVGKGTK